MATVALHGLTKRYGTAAAVAGVDLAIAEGEMVALVGPSGCGKTTILRMVAGLIEPDAGRILIGGADVTRAPAHKRNLGLVFQSYALFPHLSVFENVAFGLRRRGVAEPEIGRRVAQALALVRLEGFEARFPKQLSGGQQQRVALARAVVTEPRVLLLDEPLSNLDAGLRDAMRVELRRLQQSLGITTIFVTHDQEEALTLADRVAVMRAGRLEQVGAPQEVYERPASEFVAGFVGRTNLLEAVVEGAEGGVLRLSGPGGLPLVARGAAPPGAQVRLALRHEKLRLGDAPPGAANAHPAEVALAAFAGAQCQYVLRLPGGLELQAEAPSRPAFPQGAQVTAWWGSEDMILLPAGPGRDG